jgi:XTP/dITP diphosphohydrolase
MSPRPPARPSKPRGARPAGARPERPRGERPRLERARIDAPAAPPEPPRIPLLLASKNPGKLRELAQMLSELPFAVEGADVWSKVPAPTEDGATFEANARKKAIHYSRYVDALVIADDSGLEVDALDGAPGVRSARLAGPTASDTDRVRLIVRRLERVPWEKRTARFRCVLAVAHNGTVLETFEGTVEGLISFEPRGADGFGYDPIFYYPAAEMTFAEMTAAEKNRVSHRGQALERAVGWLREYAVSHPPEAAR